MAEVVLENIHKTFAGEKGHEVVAVDDASLTIEDREFMVFVRPSGCGKSTTLRMIAGLEEFTRGSIYIDGKKVNAVSPEGPRQRDGFPELRALSPHVGLQEHGLRAQLRNVLARV